MKALEKAIVMAAKAHDGQVDRQGEPYILHVLRVMLAGTTEAERVVGALHDVVEDTWVRLSDIYNDNFDDEVVEAVAALTREDDEAYADYIERVAQNPLATTVKINDLKDNMRRGDTLSKVARARLEDRYTKALARLETVNMIAESFREDLEGATPPAVCVPWEKPTAGQGAPCCGPLGCVRD